MTVRTRTFRRGSRTLPIAAALTAAMFAFGEFAPLHAQERPRTLFELLFAPSRPREAREPKPPVKTQRVKKPSTKTKVAKRETTQDPVAEEVVKAADAKVILVVGDFLGDGLAEGLTEAFAANASVRVVDKTNGSSGIVRNDFYDWPKEVPALIDAEKPVAVIVMLGTNDRQEMRVSGTRVPVRTPEWAKEYEQRVATLAKAVRDKQAPLIWVGMPPFKQNSMSSDMLALNDVFRAGAEAAGGAFVDIWDGFVDENGAFATTGPDIKGNPVRLRSGDNGLNFTSAAKRKVAFYVEKPLEKILGPQKQQLIGAATPSTGIPDPATPGAPVNLDRTAPMALTDPELDGGGELLGASFSTSNTARTPAEKMSIEGIAPSPVAGRADDFGDGEPARAAAPLPASPEQTTAIPPKPRG